MMSREYGFKKFLQLSEAVRKGYRESLNVPEANWRDNFHKICEEIPSFFDEIYSECGGTDSNIEAQEFFDFIPAYRLMTPKEIVDIFKRVLKEYDSESKYDSIIPFLTDYDGNFIAYARRGEEEQIVSLVPEEGITIMHKSVELFWKTIVEFYIEEVYFLDDDGFLSYDFDAEGEVGARINKGVGYWNE